MKPTPKHFHGERLLKARLARKVSPERIADLVGRTSQTVANWERGNTVPNANEVARIAEFLGKPISYFFAKAA